MDGLAGIYKFQIIQISERDLFCKFYFNIFIN